MIRENAENGRKKGKCRGYERLAERALNFSPTLPAIRRGSLCGCGAGPTPFTQPKLYNSSTSKQIVSYSMTTVVRLASCADLVHEGTTQITYDFRVCRFHMWSYCTDTGLLCTRFPSLPFIPPPTSLLWTHLAVAFHFDWRISVSKRHPFFFFFCKALARWGFWPGRRVPPQCKFMPDSSQKGMFPLLDFQFNANQHLQPKIVFAAVFISIH